MHFKVVIISVTRVRARGSGLSLCREPRDNRNKWTEQTIPRCQNLTTHHDC